MSSSRGFDIKEIDPTGSVANFWWKTATELGPQTFKSPAGSSTRMTVAGTDFEGEKIVFHARLGENLSSVRIGNIDTRSAAILHFAGGELDTDSIIASGVDLDRLAELNGVIEGPVSVGFASVTTDLQSV